MDLILWRHADAEDGHDDAQRALTPKGRKQAARMAHWLGQHLPRDFVVLASPALRTQQTAAALGVPVLTRPELYLAATPDSILQAAEFLVFFRDFRKARAAPGLRRPKVVLLTARSTFRY